MVSPFYEGERWAVRHGSMCLTLAAKWVYEPLPSSRDDDFYAKCRFDSLDAALAAYDKNPKPLASESLRRIHK
jgi:hypothetical protein